MPAIFFARKTDIDFDSEKMIKLGFKYVALPYGAYGRNTISVLNKYYKLAFAFDRQGFPYVTKYTNIFRLNRIAIDGESATDILKKYLY